MRRTLGCEGYIKARMHKLPFPTHNEEESVKFEIGEFTHSDVGTIGKGYRWIGTFTDHASDFSAVYLLHHSSEVFEKFSEYKANAELQTGRKIKRISSDRGGEYLTDKLKQLTVREGIVHQTSLAHTPEQNLISEQLNRTLMDKALAALHGAVLSTRGRLSSMQTASVMSLP
jgi:transposase InsO family protein